MCLVRARALRTLRAMRTLRAFPTRDPKGNPVTQEASEKIYGSGAGR